MKKLGDTYMTSQINKLPDNFVILKGKWKFSGEIANYNCKAYWNKTNG